MQFDGLKGGKNQVVHHQGLLSRICIENVSRYPTSNGDTSGKRNPQMEFLPIVQDSLPTKRISIKVLRY